MLFDTKIRASLRAKKRTELNKQKSQGAIMCSRDMSDTHTNLKNKY